jgi:hypothetical protein
MADGRSAGRIPHPHGLDRVLVAGRVPKSVDLLIREEARGLGRSMSDVVASVLAAHYGLEELVLGQFTPRRRRKSQGVRPM